MKRTRSYQFLLIMVLLSGCTALKYIPKEEQLYTGAKIEVIATKKITDQKIAVSAVKDLIRPKTNTKILASRPLLWIYFVAGTPKKETGFRHWLKTKVGEPPVYKSMTDPVLVSKAIDAKLYNMGFFNSYSQPEIIESKNEKTSSVIYKLFLYEPYTFQKIIFPKDSDILSKYITASEKGSLLKKDKRYDLDLLLQERARIDDRLKRHGFYYFNPDHILFKTDTALGNGKLLIYITLKPEIPEKAKLTYRIAEVNVYPDYKLGKDSLNGNKEVIDSVNYYDKTGYIKHEPVLRTVFIKNNQVYNRYKHNLTLNHLNGLGVFKFVNVRITEKDTATEGWLSANIFLIPLPQKSVSVEMQGVSKSNNFIGPALTLSLRNRNAFKGAELMIYNLRGSFETQLNGLYKGQYTYEIDPRIELYVPRFMVPFKFKVNNNYVPRTKFILDYSFLSRVGYFDLNSFKFIYGYKWKQTRTIDHDLSLVSINYYNIYNTSSLFNDFINSNILLKRRFEEQFIAGIAYSFFYNEQLKRIKKNQVYFNGNIELAGNTLSLYKKVISGENSTAGNPSKAFGINFAQFAKMDIDVRDYFHLGEKSMIASRFIAGWGLPYGNSFTMPYVKQFFSGGAYSVRGFPAYAVGPGSYAPPDSSKGILFLQQGGEIKLEANIEYRFPIVGIFRGALFADAGNVWLNNKSTDLPGAEFNGTRFIKEIAVGVGAGLRIDLNFFVLRLDLGVPARKPWLPEGQRWMLNQINFSDVIFNLAFGYPF